MCNGLEKNKKKESHCPIWKIVECNQKNGNNGEWNCDNCRIEKAFQRQSSNEPNKIWNCK